MSNLFHDLDSSTQEYMLQLAIMRKKMLSFSALLVFLLPHLLSATVSTDDGGCKKNGECVDDNDLFLCVGYGYFNGEIVYAIGRECYSENGEASDNCVGTFCDTNTNTCEVLDAVPRVIYNPINTECEFHFECEKGLYCALDTTQDDEDDDKGICSACQAGECPEKGDPNFHTCNRGED